jgi:adenylate cyclase
MKFKYGPLGNTVNLASRVQGATKVLKVPLLITSAVHETLPGSFGTRRLCPVRLHNIAEPVMLFELVDTGVIGWESLKHGYEQALQVFSQGEFRQACRILGRLIPDHPEDGPSLLLLSRAVGCLVKSPEVFDPTFVMEGK